VQNVRYGYGRSLHSFGHLNFDSYRYFSSFEAVDRILGVLKSFGCDNIGIQRPFRNPCPCPCDILCSIPVINLCVTKIIYH
jgi:hypothetical protein